MCLFLSGMIIHLQNRYMQFQKYVSFFSHYFAQAADLQHFPSRSTYKLFKYYHDMYSLFSQSIVFMVRVEEKINKRLGWDYFFGSFHTCWTSFYPSVGCFWSVSHMFNTLLA